MTKQPSRFIVLEGLDGAGTTTQAERLGHWLRQQGHQAHLTAEPSEGPIGRLIRDVLRGELLGANGEGLSAESIAGLFLADRADHIKSEIQPKLDAGCFVVCDRYLLSSLAYQGIDAPMEWVAQVNAPMPAPGLTLMVTVSPEVAAQRRQGRGGQTEIYELSDFQRKVALGYERACVLKTDHNIVHVDGEQCMDTVFDSILSHVRRTYEI